MRHRKSIRIGSGLLRAAAAGAISPAEFLTALAAKPVTHLEHGSRISPTQEFRPYVFEGAWEALIVANLTYTHHIDFWRIEPTGRFYQRRALDDDMAQPPHGPQPLKALDFALVIWRTSEAMAVALSFAKALGCSPETTNLQFSFRWSKLNGRTLCCWTEPGRSPLARTARQESVVSAVSVPLEIAPSAIFQYVNEAIQPLFQVFEGFELGKTVVEEITAKALRLSR